MGVADDKEEIRDLYYRYAFNWDDNRPDDVAACFAPDAVWFGDQIGRDAVAENVRTLNRRVAGFQTFHIVTNIRIEVDGDAATGRAYFSYTLARPGEVEKQYGTYNDTFRRIDGRWYFASRTPKIAGGTGPLLPSPRTSGVTS